MGGSIQLALALSQVSGAKTSKKSQAHRHWSENCAMATARSFETTDYKLFPSPRNVHRVVFEHQVFVPQPYALIDLPSYHLGGRYSLFAACRLSDGKMGQLVTLEQADDIAKFKAKFVPD